MFCKKCGNPFSEGDRVCTNCGAPRANAPAEKEATPTGEHSMGAYDWLFALSSLLAVIGVFVPCYSVGRYIGGAYINSCYGVWILVFTSLAFIFGYKGRFKQVKFFSFLALALVVHLFIRAMNFGYGSFEVGFFLMLAGNAAMFALPYTKLVESATLFNKK